MSKEMEFFIYLLEHYAEYKNTTGDKVFEKWEELNLIDKIIESYELYHIEAIENAYDDIDGMIAEKENEKNN